MWDNTRKEHRHAQEEKGGIDEHEYLTTYDTITQWKYNTIPEHTRTSETGNETLTEEKRGKEDGREKIRQRRALKRRAMRMRTERDANDGVNRTQNSGRENWSLFPVV